MRFFVLISAIFLAPTLVQAGKPTLELKIGDESYVGCAVAHNERVCWLAHPDGHLQEVAVPRVTSFRKLDRDFEGLTALEARNALRRELGREWEIVGTGHYLVCSQTGSGREYARHFEDLYRSFVRYFNRRGFKLPEPEFPLIAMVFADPRSFAEQCVSDNVAFVPGLRGYYHRKTNRINLFENGDSFTAVEPLPLRLREDLASREPFGSANPFGRADASIQGSLKDTITHEATHQLAFNLGLHSRIGTPPKWVVEGLATMFEAEGTRRNTGGSPAKTRVNEERVWWFAKYRQERRKAGSLPDFIATENAFRRSVLDFYSEAWALTFFLAETRPKEYAEYLQLVADRDPLKLYGAVPRLADFQRVFGTDLARIEVDMLRFFDNID